MQKYQIMFEARNQQILFNKDTQVFYYKDLDSGDIMYIPPVLQEFLRDIKSYFPDFII